MRLAHKIFLAQAGVILVLAAVALWSVREIASLSAAERSITVRVADALRLEAGLREAVLKAARLEMRSLVFGDREYTAVANAEADRIQQDLDRVAGFLTTDEERLRLRDAVERFGEYRAAVARVRGLHERGERQKAEALLQTVAEPAVTRIVENLDRLIEITRGALDQTQIEATAALGQARLAVEHLKTRTWTAVSAAMIVAVLAALAGTAAVAVRMTRSLRRLSQATKSLAEGAFREPLPVESSDEIGALAASFNRMAACLRELDEMKERFYATVSHELRSPLTSVRESARLFTTGTSEPLTPRQERLVAIIQRSSERLLRIVGDILDLARASAGRLPLELRRFELVPTIVRALEELRPQAEQRRVALRFEADPGVKEIFGDEERIVQIVVNLVANALRFTPAGGTVAVRLVDAGAETEIRVEDTGLGIPPDQLPTVFDRFRQAHRGRGGTGLGLAIVRTMVDAHGGRVSVASEEGKGTRFVVSLPRQSREAAAHAAEVPLA
jgi:signal transduction histidine kinase